jgi:antitoxin (DNA-binding transcriptional repressor) of toxin-antitoxin stability system
MRTHLHELTEDFAQALRAMKAGKQVVLTDNGNPVGMIEPLRAASKEEEHAIQEMINSGELEPTGKAGTVREFKWRKVIRHKAA